GIATERLTLKDAVSRALSKEGNARVRLAEETRRQADARARQARAALLPNIDASVTEQSVTRNLQAVGIRLEIPVPRVRPLTFVGPFRVFDARATASQAILDLAALRRFKAARATADEAEFESAQTDEEVRRLVARAYLAAARAEAAVETAAADVRLGEAM